MAIDIEKFHMTINVPGKIFYKKARIKFSQECRHFEDNGLGSNRQSDQHDTRVCNSGSIEDIEETYMTRKVAEKIFYKKCS